MTWAFSRSGPRDEVRAAIELAEDPSGMPEPELRSYDTAMASMLALVAQAPDDHECQVQAHGHLSSDGGHGRVSILFTHGTPLHDPRARQG